MTAKAFCEQAAALFALPELGATRLQARATCPCRCGHTADAHDHYRPGTDCAHCPCARRRRGLRWLMALIGGEQP